MKNLSNICFIRIKINGERSVDVMRDLNISKSTLRRYIKYQETYGNIFLRKLSLNIKITKLQKDLEDKLLVFKKSIQYRDKKITKLQKYLEDKLLVFKKSIQDVCDLDNKINSYEIK